MQTVQDFDRTTKISRPASAAAIASNLLVTVFDGNTSPRTFSLDGTRGGSITFGRSEDNDIVLSSRLVSRQHGRFVYRKNQWFIEDKALYGDSASKNGLICNNVSVRSRALCEGDFIRIDDGVETIPEGVLFVFASQGAGSKWDLLNLGGKWEITIGRDSNCDIVLPHISVSKHHATIVEEHGQFYKAKQQSTTSIGAAAPHGCG